MKGEGEKTRIEKEMLRKGKSTAGKSKAIRSDQSKAEKSTVRGTKNNTEEREDSTEGNP